ncbi:hypothetical protein [Streptomyces sp. bgisy100]|uniref:hypothetical protein n=1 Tax=Streptomyces sp. bgisy100 TaxID=3413783 RepID=UPI003D761889
MTRDVRTRCLAALAALCAVAAVPGTAVADGAQGLAEYRTAEGAQAVEGTASSANAERIEPGIYTDSIGRGETRYYSVTLDATSTAFVSAVAVPKPGTRVEDYSDSLDVVLEDNDGNECGSGEVSFTGNGMAYPMGNHATRRIGADVLQCQRRGPYFLKVERGGKATSDPGRWPIEIRYMSEPGLKGGASAGQEPGSWSTATPAPLTGTAARKEARGGTGFNDARSVAEGIWKDRIRPGETRFFRVPVDWGQRLNLSAELPNAAGGQQGVSAPFITEALGLTVYNPARGLVDDDNFAAYQGKQTAATLFTAPVEYGNRFRTETGVPPMCVAGWYYLAVSLHPKTEAFFPKGADLTLRVDVKGEPKAAPRYRGDAVKAGFGVSDEDREMAEQGQTAAESERSDSRQLVAVAGFGAGTVLLLGLGAWTLAARRRATRAPAGAPDPVPSAVGTTGAQQAHVPHQSPPHHQPPAHPEHSSFPRPQQPGGPGGPGGQSGPQQPEAPQQPESPPYGSPPVW